MGEVTPSAGARRGSLVAPARLGAHHDVSRFSCGHAALDDWLKGKAHTSEGKTARTYVVCEGDIVVGYYCVAMGSVERKTLPSRVTRPRGTPNQIPVIVLGRLARDERYAGTDLGKDLLKDALSRIVAASETVGVRGILVHAIDDRAARFYKRFGFLDCPVDDRTFFLPIETAIDAL